MGLQRDMLGDLAQFRSNMQEMSDSFRINSAVFETTIEDFSIDKVLAEVNLICQSLKQN